MFSLWLLAIELVNPFTLIPNPIMVTGTVKFFNESKGFGFIVDDESKRDIFVHVTGLNGLTIREQDRVQYEVVDGKKGLNAVKVTKLS